MFYDENLLKHSRFPPENFNDGCFLSDNKNLKSIVLIKIGPFNNSLHFFQDSPLIYDPTLEVKLSLSACSITGKLCLEIPYRKEQNPTKSVKTQRNERG